MIRRTAPDRDSVTAVYDMLNDMFGFACDIDRSVVRRNIMYGCPGGMSLADRSIDPANAKYLVKNYPVILAGLMCNHRFTLAFLDAIGDEIHKQHSVDRFRLTGRKRLDKGAKRAMNHKMTVDFSHYDFDMHIGINRAVIAGMDKYSNCNEAIDVLSRRLTNLDREVIGYCVSNFMLILSAFDKNVVFRSDVKCVVDDVINSLGSD